MGMTIYSLFFFNTFMDVNSVCSWNSNVKLLQTVCISLIKSHAGKLMAWYRWFIIGSWMGHRWPTIMFSQILLVLCWQKSLGQRRPNLLGQPRADGQNCIGSTSFANVGPTMLLTESQRWPNTWMLSGLNYIFSSSDVSLSPFMFERHYRAP